MVKRTLLINSEGFILKLVSEGFMTFVDRALRASKRFTDSVDERSDCTELAV